MANVNNNPLTDKDYKKLCQCNNELPGILEDIEHAIKAGVPNAEELKRRCLAQCKMVADLKHTYFTGKA